MAICLPVPVLAASGLALPLPTTAYRIFAGLVAETQALASGGTATVPAPSPLDRPGGKIVLSEAEVAVVAGMPLRLETRLTPGSKPGGKAPTTREQVVVALERSGMTAGQPLRKPRVGAAARTASDHPPATGRSASSVAPEAETAPSTAASSGPIVGSAGADEANERAGDRNLAAGPAGTPAASSTPSMPSTAGNSAAPKPPQTVSTSGVGGDSARPASSQPNAAAATTPAPAASDATPAPAPTSGSGAAQSTSGAGTVTKTDAGPTKVDNGAAKQERAAEKADDHAAKGKSADVAAPEPDAKPGKDKHTTSDAKPEDAAKADKKFDTVPDHAPQADVKPAPPGKDSVPKDEVATTVDAKAAKSEKVDAVAKDTGKPEPGVKVEPVENDAAKHDDAATTKKGGPK